jgi:hypothetical protein
VLPDADATRSLGSSARRWLNAYLSGRLYFDTDVSIYRSAADVLKTDDNFDALALRIGGTEIVDSVRNLKNVFADAGIITSGTFDVARIPILPRSKISDFWDAPFWPNIPDKPAMLLEGQKGTGTTNASGDASITFPVAFDTAPLVFLQGKDASARGIVLDVVSVTTTGFTVKARKTTGITTGSAGAHTHSFTPSGSISSVSAGTPSGSISSDSAGTPSGTISSDSAGTPSGTIGSAGDHSHTSFSLGGTFSWSTPGYYRYILRGSDGVQVNARVEADSSQTSISIPSSTAGAHTHTFTGDALPTHTHTFTGSALPTHSHTFTGSALPTHSHTFTGSSGTTGSAGDHSHSVDAPVLSVDFMWVAIKV